MNYEIEAIPGKPIIMAALSESFDLVRDSARMVDELLSVLNTQPAPVFYISDARSMRVNFGDMVGLMGFMAKDHTALHPNIREVVVITSSDMVSLGAKALDQTQYSNLPVSVFGSIEEAFDYVNSRSVMH